MAVTTAERTRTSTARTVARRSLIARTARIWSRLYKETTASLKDIAHNWLDKVQAQARRDIASGYMADAPELPLNFTEELQKKLREAMAQGYWLNHLYVRELQAAYQGRKYQGKIKLSDTPDDELIELLREFINLDGNEEWHKVIPTEAVNWLDNYVPKLAGGFSASVLDKVREVMQQSLLSGATLKERMKALRESSEELAKLANQRIEAIARTEITRADSMGRLISMKSNDDVIGVEFSAVMDDRTTEICIERNGLVMRIDDARLAENTPPLHVNCRSMLLSLTVYDYPDGVLTSREFDNAPTGIQRSEDVAEVQKLLDAFMSNATGEGIGQPEQQTQQPQPKESIRDKVERLRQQDADYERQYHDLNNQMQVAVSARDIQEYNRLAERQAKILTVWRETSTQLQDTKIEAAEQGVIFASGIAKTLPSDDVQVVVKLIKNAPEPIRKVWNVYEDKMKIASTQTKGAYYSPRDKAVYFNLSSDRDTYGYRPQYNTLCHELGHLIDNKSAWSYHSKDEDYDLYKTLTAEVNAYVNKTLKVIKENAVSAGENPKLFKRNDAYKAVTKEMMTQLEHSSRMALSDIFSGVTLNKVDGGWGHSTNYWKQDRERICLEFFAQTFSDSITNPEGIEVTKKYLPKSYKIFEQIINNLGVKSNEGNTVSK